MRHPLTITGQPPFTLSAAFTQNHHNDNLRAKHTLRTTPPDSPTIHYISPNRLGSKIVNSYTPFALKHSSYTDTDVVLHRVLYPKVHGNGNEKKKKNCIMRISTVIHRFRFAVPVPSTRMLRRRVTLGQIRGGTIFMLSESFQRAENCQNTIL